MSEDEKRAELVREHDIKKTTVIFMIVATLVELLLSLICIIILLLGIGFIIYRVFGAETLAPLQLSSPIIFIGGLVAGYCIYKRGMRFVIDRLGLKDKLKEDVYDQYLTRKERRLKEDMR